MQTLALLLLLALLLAMAFSADAARRTRGVATVQIAYRNSVIAAVVSALALLGGGVALAMQARSSF